MTDEALPAYKPGSRPSEASPCTYSLGYVRQDVYSCSQCSKPDGMGGKLISGFCVGCKTACHGDHLDKVIDLYSKRYFRCDCGNNRMNNACNLDPSKTPYNKDNEGVYNHNFKGTYCRCDRVYDTKWGDMLQCAVCEDWFHEVCLKMMDGTPSRRVSAKLSRISCELICAECCDKLPILDEYFAVYGLFPPHAPIAELQPAPPRASGCKRPPSVEHAPLHDKDRLWPSGFRLKLCKCPDCAAEYERLGVPYITERKDFVNLAGIPEEDLLSNAPETLQDVLKTNNNNNTRLKTPPRKTAARKRTGSANTTPMRPRKKKATPTPSPARIATPKKPKTNTNRAPVPMLRDVVPEDIDDDEDEDEDMNDTDYNYNDVHMNGNSDDDEDEGVETEDVDDVSDEVDSDSLTGCTSSADDAIRWKDAPLPVVELTDKERERIRSGVASFINDALAKQKDSDSGVPDAKTLKKYLEKLRSDILNGTSQ